jgi:acetyl-CoA carboxylase/biotin carboxylase 1
MRAISMCSFSLTSRATIFLLFGRDCSMQRGNQRILEEAPISNAEQDTFEAMKKAVMHLEKLVGYMSTGLTGYFCSYAGGFFYFLEFKPSLQVGHPITEMVTSVNLPAVQLQIAWISHL